jgi:hypothetical protein
MHNSVGGRKSHTVFIVQTQDWGVNSSGLTITRTSPSGQLVFQFKQEYDFSGVGRDTARGSFPFAFLGDSLPYFSHGNMTRLSRRFLW